MIIPRTGIYRVAGILLSSVVLVIASLLVLSNKIQLDTEFMQGMDLSGLTDRLYQHVWKLSEEIGERHYENPGSLQKTADYIEEVFIQSGLTPYVQVYDQGYRNIIVDIEGVSNPNEIILTGAHYDTVWLSPGADDNASGVAVMLELARVLATFKFEKSLRFIAFTNEEQPFAGTADMGSMVYARQLPDKQEKIVAMYSLEMLGYYSDQSGSQQYPPPLGWLYPDKGSFIAFIANVSSGLLLFRSLLAFRQNSDFPNQGLLAPEALVPDIRRSDHASFWDNGYAALMVTDTANYRNINYHTVGDVPRTLNYEKMAELTRALALMIAAIAQPVN